LNRIIRRRSRFWPLACLVVALACPGFGALAVPKAAEHEEGEVSFGEAVGAPPKAGAKAPKPAPAGQPVKTTAGKQEPAAGRRPATAAAKTAGKTRATSPPATAKPGAAAKPQGKSKAAKK